MLWRVIGIFVILVFSKFALVQEIHNQPSRAGQNTAEFLLIKALDAYFKGNLDEAAVSFERYIQLVGDREVPLRYLGKIALEKGEIAKAISYFERASKSEGETTESLFFLAELYLKTGKSKAAIQTLEKILEKDQFHERALSALGYLWQQKDPRKASAYYKRLILAVQKGSNNPELLYQSYSFLGNYYYQQGNYHRAILYYKKIVELDPQNLRNQLILGELYKISGNFSQSALTLEALLQQQPFYEGALESIIESLFILQDNRIFRYLRDVKKTSKAEEKLIQAITFFYQENYSESEKFFQEVLKENPNRLSAHIGIAKIAQKRNDRRKMRDEFFTAVVLSQKVGAYSVALSYIIPVFQVMAEESEKMGFYENFFAPNLKSESLSEDIEQQALDYTELYATHAETLENVNQKRLALVYYIQAMRYVERLLYWYEQNNGTEIQNEKKQMIQSKAYQILINQAWLAQSQEISRPEQALRYLKQAQEIFPKGATAVFLTGAILYGLGEKDPQNYKEAENFLSKALKLAEQNHKQDPEKNRVPANYYFYYAMALEKNAKFPEAEKYFWQAIEAEPLNSHFQNYLGYLYSLRNEKISEAHDLLLRALEDDPENEAYLDSYGWILFRMGKKREALEQLILAANFASIKGVVDAVIFYHLAEVYYSLQDYSLAHFYYSKTLENLNKSSEKLDEAYIKERLEELQTLRNGSKAK